MLGPNEISQICLATWGSSLKDYIIPSSSSSLDGSWQWKDFSELNLDQTELSMLKSLIKDRVFFIKQGSDEIIWNGAKSGVYNVKDGYKILSECSSTNRADIPLQLCRHNASLLKVGLFMWAASQGRILIVDKFVRMGYQGPSRFPCVSIVKRMLITYYYPTLFLQSAGVGYVQN